MSDDPWKHRSSSMLCRSCMWYVPKQATVFIVKGELEVPLDVRPGKVVAATEVETKRTAIGRCRRHAPTMNGYPVVYETDWCGDHKLDEEKI